MKQYVDLLEKILKEGEFRADRTGVGSFSIFGGQLVFDLRDRFPLVTIKKTLHQAAFTEMLWFLRGEGHTDYLKLHDLHIWDAWADDRGNVGPIYGVQWRHWPTRNGGEVDQIKALIEGIIKNPQGRRHIVTAWNPADLGAMGLPPCHRDFQCFVSNDGHLDLMMAIRSWDTCLGGPFNIAQYALLTHLIARATGYTPRFLKINYGDAHIYSNHVDAIRERLRTVRPVECPTRLVFRTGNTDIDGYKPEDFAVECYECHPFLKLPIAV